MSWKIVSRCPLICVLLAGCDTAKPPPPGRQTAEPVKVAAAPAVEPVKAHAEPLPAPPQLPEKKEPPPLTVRYQGRLADAWGQDLLDADEATSTRGAFALWNIGKEGVPFVIKGLQSDNVNTRFIAINAGLNGNAAKTFKAELLPVLMALLKDESAPIRRFTALAFANCGFKEGLPAIRDALKIETDADAKKSMSYAIEELSK